MSLSPIFLAAFLTPAKVRKLVSDEERRCFGWEDQDYDNVCANVLEEQKQPSRSNAKSIEAQLGADPSWQIVCDLFAKTMEKTISDAVQTTAKLSALASHTSQDHLDVIDPVPATEESGKKKTEQFSFTIYACKDDRIATSNSVLWLSELYNTADLVVEERVYSHELLTMFGGPPRDPVILHEIVRERWGLVG